MSAITCDMCQRNTVEPDEYGSTIDAVSECPFCEGTFCDDCCYTNNDYGLICMNCDRKIEDQFIGETQYGSLRDYLMDASEERVLEVEAQGLADWSNYEATRLEMLYADEVIDVAQDVIARRHIVRRG